MAQCYDPQLNQYVYCSSGFGTYIAVGIVLPLGVLILTIIITAFVRYRRRRSQREQQQIAMNSIVSINNDETEYPNVPYTYSYPPQYTSIDQTIYDKPPSYEQTVQHLGETNVTSQDSAAVLPVTTMTVPTGTQSSSFTQRET